jgi:transcriptional regulator with XRE-family HTH domain
MKIEDLDGLDPQKIATRLRLTREVIGMTQIAFAERAQLKPNAYTQYETAVNRPSIEAAAALVQTYQLTLDWIYLGDASNLPSRITDGIRAVLKARGSQP